MTSESKILTVSYGTFSCTLEGFEDPFDTMKAIAEYFRELAAQDRHFGAEPPPPDAAMLHRLAEREVSRLAGTAPRDDSALIGQGAARTEPAAATGPRIQINTPVRRRVSQEPASSDYAADDDVATPEPALQDVIPDGVAAKLARIRQAVHPIPATMTAPFPPFPVEPEAAEDELAETELVEAGTSITEDEVEAVSALDSAFDTDIFANEVADLSAESELEVDAALDTAAEADTSRTEEVEASEAPAEAASPQDPAVGTFDESATEEAGFAELHDRSADDIESDLAGERVEEPSEQLAEEASSPEAVIELAPDLAATDDDSVEDDSDEEVTLLARLDGVDPDQTAYASADDDSLPEDAPAEITLADAEIQDPLPEATSETTPETTWAEDIVSEAAPVAEAGAEAAPEPDSPDAEPVQSYGNSGGRARRLNSRVVRIHPDEDKSEAATRRDAGATRVLDAEGEADEIARLMQQAEDVMAEDENRRRQEALSHLKAAVVSTEADRADVDFEAPAAEADHNPYRDDLAEAIVPDAAEGPTAKPEVKPRRKTVSVRPQELRPGTIRPGMISPPPLVLVSEQRIDRMPAAAPPAAAPSVSPAVPGIGPAVPDGQPMVALRTGRLTGAIGAGAALASSGMPARNLVLEKPSYGTAADVEEDEELSEDSREIDESGFAAFAEIVGAKSMADMLEAAAAYATCVENRVQFTRPQLMRRMMASAGGNSVSREDGLRSFGTLLRTGRIEKVTRGHYSLAENSPYLAEARRLS
jgi:hypothetical protein